ncbi:Uncharacterized protein FWK35_00019472 [Aphis craccivora]|uniref:Uncharacterized protein n=1 Tax=Aphis craccivora TaxID=307492 RepID=A0A6G0YXQ9_APHCR|nr:Uncharacterized protein FWK35_00019472 [Aphis craccivora]
MTNTKYLIRYKVNQDMESRYTYSVDTSNVEKHFNIMLMRCSITSRNNAQISNFGGSFRCKSEYPWCIIEVKSKHFPKVFKKIEKNKKKIMEKREF